MDCSSLGTRADYPYKRRLLDDRAANNTLKERLNARRGAPETSSYSAASSSCKCCGWNNFGRRYCLMLVRRKNGKGNSIPAIGIHVIPKHRRKYTHWKSVKMSMYLNGTVSTKEA